MLALIESTNPESTSAPLSALWLHSTRCNPNRVGAWQAAAATWVRSRQSILLGRPLRGRSFDETSNLS